MSAITRFLPRNHVSYFVGKVVQWRGPRSWARWSIEKFAKTYKINVSEAEFPLSAYPSLGEFFVRRLKPGARPIADAWAVHPSDSEITQQGPIVAGKLIQAKGKTFSVQEFLADPQAAKRFEGGSFITYYLCPTDYHRVHSPMQGLVQKVIHVPGELWPVNKWSVENIEDLFSVNERVIIEMATDFGPMAVVLVGATNVGQIELSFDKKIRGNQLNGGGLREIVYKTPIDIEKGQELGMFRMGSTVVVVYSEEFIKRFQGKLRLGPYVKVGQALTFE